MMHVFFGIDRNRAYSSMADEVTDVYQKVSFLHEHERPRRVAGMGESRGLKPLCMLLAQRLNGKAPRKTISDQIKAGKLNTTYQKAMAAVFGFPVGEREWQTGSAEDFKKWYLATHPTPSLAPFEPELETGVALQAVCLEQTRPFDPHLAAIDFLPRQSGPGEPWPVDISLCCQPALVESIRLAVKCGRIRIDAGGARTGPVTERDDYLKGVEFRGGHGAITVTPAGDERHPSWELDAGDNCIGIVRTSPEDFFFCKLYGLRPGTAVTVHFTVYFKDLEVIEPEDGEAHGGLGPFESFMLARPADGKKLSAAKKLIFKRLAERHLPNGHQGWAELCSDGRVFRKIDSGSEA